MARKRKDAVMVTFNMDRGVTETLHAYADKQEQTMTVIVERALREFFAKRNFPEDRERNEQSG